MPVVKINVISAPPQAHQELERRFTARADSMNHTPGFLGFQLLRPVKGEERFFVVTHWVDDAAFEAWRGDEGQGGAAAAHSGADGERAQPVSSGAELLEFEVVLDTTHRPPANGE